VRRSGEDFIRESRIFVLAPGCFENRCIRLPEKSMQGFFPQHQVADAVFSAAAEEGHDLVVVPVPQVRGKTKVNVARGDGSTEEALRDEVPKDEVQSVAQSGMSA
jgi:hypothetical protein